MQCTCIEYINIHANIHLFIYIHLRLTHNVFIPKTKKFGCAGRGDLTFLFKSCEIDRSQRRLV